MHRLSYLNNLKAQSSGRVGSRKSKTKSSSMQTFEFPAFDSFREKVPI